MLKIFGLLAIMALTSCHAGVGGNGAGIGVGATSSYDSARSQAGIGNYEQ